MGSSASDLGSDVALGAVVAAGSVQGGWPTWRAAMTPLTWAVVPTANALADVDPEDSATYNPSYPSSAPWHGAGGQPMVLDAWGGLTPSQDDGRIWMALGGGHGDYAGNESYVIDMRAEAPAWSMLHPPSGAVGQPAVANYSDGQEATGLYSDGRMRAGHTYNQGLHVPGGDIFIATVPAPYYNPVSTTQKSFWIDIDTGVHSLASDYTALTDVQGSGEGGSCYDPVRHCIWHVRTAAVSNRILKSDLASGVTTAHGASNTWVGGAARFVYVPGHDVVVNLTGIGAGFCIWDPATLDWTRAPSSTGALPAGISNTVGVGAAWVPELGKILIWNHSSNTATFATLTPPASNPTGGTWTFGSLSPDGSNAVTPAAKGGNPTYGKCGYLPALKGMYLKPTFAASMYFFATS